MQTPDRPLLSPRRRLAIASAVFAACAACAAAALPTSANAEAQHLRPHDPEAWAMFHFTSLTIFSGLGTPRHREPWSAELGLELGNVPHLSVRESTVGFEGTVPESLNHSPLVARPVLTIGLPWDVSLALAYIPPVKMFGVRPNLFAIAIERPLYEQGPWMLGLRLHGQVGHSRGAFTCSAGMASHEPGSAQNPVGCGGKSNDRATQDYVGVEVSGSRRFDDFYRLTPYLTLGANYLDNHFHVHADTFGNPDRSNLSADTWTFSLGTGVNLPLGENTWFNLGVFYTPLWVTRPPDTSQDRDSAINARAEISYRLR